MYHPWATRRVDRIGDRTCGPPAVRLGNENVVPKVSSSCEQLVDTSDMSWERLISECSTCLPEEGVQCLLTEDAQNEGFEDLADHESAKPLLPLPESIEHDFEHDADDLALDMIESESPVNDLPLDKFEAEVSVRTIS